MANTVEDKSSTLVDIPISTLDEGSFEQAEGWSAV
jgi:hypothetical protein